MAITSEQVKDLRDRSGVPMMKCKQALEATNGDFEAAIEWLRKQGVAAADKRAGRITSNGALGLAVDGGAGVLVLLSCETDFVSSNQEFKDFVAKLAQSALAAKAGSPEAAGAAPFPAGGSCQDAITQMIAKIGENMKIAAVARVEGAAVAGYNHGGRVATLAAGAGDVAALKHLAMHIAASNPAPVALKREQVPAAVLDKEREIALASDEVQAKPEAIRPKIVEGKLQRFYKENVLLEQEMLVDAESGTQVQAWAKAKGVEVSAFARLAV